MTNEQSQPMQVPIGIANAILSILQQTTGITARTTTLRNTIMTPIGPVISRKPAGILIAYIDARHEQRTFYVVIQENLYGSNYKHTILTGTCDTNDKLNADIQNPEELIDNNLINLCYKWAIETLEVFIRDANNCIASYNENIETHRRWIQERYSKIGTRHVLRGIWTEEDVESLNRFDLRHIDEFLQAIEDKRAKIASASSRLANLTQ